MTEGRVVQKSLRILLVNPRKPENCSFYLRVHFHKQLQASPAEVTKILKGHNSAFGIFSENTSH